MYTRQTSDSENFESVKTVYWCPWADLKRNLVLRASISIMSLEYMLKKEVDHICELIG